MATTGTGAAGGKMPSTASICRIACGNARARSWNAKSTGDSSGYWSSSLVVSTCTRVTMIGQLQRDETAVRLKSKLRKRTLIVGVSASRRIPSSTSLHAFSFDEPFSKGASSRTASGEPRHSRTSCLPKGCKNMEM